MQNLHITLGNRPITPYREGDPSRAPEGAVMHPDFWRAPLVRALITARDIGGTIRMARESHGWRQIDLARRAGYSASTISRLETGRTASTDLVKIRAICNALAMPPHIVGELLGLQPPGGTTVVTHADSAQEDPMRRRSLIAAAGLAVPLSLASLDEALALLPDTGPATLHQVTRRLVRARHQWDNGDLRALIAGLPTLLASAHRAAETSGEPSGWALIAACYDLAAEALDKVGAKPQARITVDRAMLYAARSEDPVAMASAARTLGIVLRHEGRHELAERVTIQATTRVADAGLDTTARAAAYAQMLCTSAYTAALADDRDSALEARPGRAGAAQHPVPDRCPAGRPVRGRCAVGTRRRRPRSGGRA